MTTTVTTISCIGSPTQISRIRLAGGGILAITAIALGIIPILASLHMGVAIVHEIGRPLLLTGSALTGLGSFACFCCVVKKNTLPAPPRVDEEEERRAPIRRALVEAFMDSAPQRKPIEEAIFGLPYDITYPLLFRLSLSDIARCRLVSKACRDFCSQHPIWELGKVYYDFAKADLAITFISPEQDLMAFADGPSDKRTLYLASHSCLHSPMRAPIINLEGTRSINFFFSQGTKRVATLRYSAASSPFPHWFDLWDENLSKSTTSEFFPAPQTISWYAQDDCSGDLYLLHQSRGRRDEWVILNLTTRAKSLIKSQPIYPYEFAVFNQNIYILTKESILVFNKEGDEIDRFGANSSAVVELQFYEEALLLFRRDGAIEQWHISEKGLHSLRYKDQQEPTSQITIFFKRGDELFGRLHFDEPPYSRFRGWRFIS